MLESPRWRIALWFVLLSSITYISLTAAGVLFFTASLTREIDDELRLLASELYHEIKLKDGVLHLTREATESVQSRPIRLQATVQLFDKTDKLLEEYGPRGIERMLLHHEEVVKPETREAPSYKVRVWLSPLLNQGVLVGFLQIQVPVTSRDTAVNSFVYTVMMVAPLVLIGLGAASYFVSGKAMQPVSDSLRTLKQFMADAGHELTTPLSIVRARAESLEHSLKKQGIEQSELTVIATAAERMTNIVADLMMLAEIEGPLQQAPKVGLDLSVIADTIVAEFAARFEEQGIKLERGAKQHAFVRGHRSALQQMLANLLENALRYTNTGGTVTVSTFHEASESLIIIEDTGIGIPAECIPRLFERFYRVDESRSRQSGGSGLGLSIVKAIIDNHSGVIMVDSKVGKGTRFQVSLPGVKNEVSRRSN